MFTPLVRIILVVASVSLAVVFYQKDLHFNMALCIMAAVLFTYGYFAYGTVYAAFNQLKKGNTAKASNLIRKVKNPNNLQKGHKAYYHFVNGILASENQDWDQSFSELNSALSLGLRTKNDTSIVLLNLANVELQRKNLDQADDLIKRVNEFDLKPEIEKEVHRIENAISKVSNPTNIQ